MTQAGNRKASEPTSLPLEKRAKAPARNDAIDLYWLAFLLTGRRDVSIEIASDVTIETAVDTAVSKNDTAVSRNDSNQFFEDWMRVWSRRIVIAKALEAIREELAESALRTQLPRVHPWTAPRGWSLGPDTTKSQIEKALLSIDLFPRAAVLLLIFEGIPIADAATLLNADAALVKKGQAIGLLELTANLAGKQGPAVLAVSPALA
jgi:DNA-directed RNA polymerase specialized sigma24 family protein